MAITYGDWLGSGTQRYRLGYEFTQTPATVDADTTSVTVRLRIQIDTDWDISDSSNSFIVDGAWSRTGSFNVNVDSGNYQWLYDQAITVNTSTSGVVKRSFAATLSGINAVPGTAEVSGTHTVAQRPFDAPGAPSTPSTLIENIGQTTLFTNWTAPADWGGNNTGDYQVQWSVDPDFDPDIHQSTVPDATSYNVPDLTPGTQYYLHVRANNGVYGPFSETKPFSTKGPPFNPGGVTIQAGSITDHTATALVSKLVGPFNNTEGNAALVTQVQVAKLANWSDAVTFTVLQYGGAVPLTGLDASTLYHTRTRFANEEGQSQWIVGSNFTTLAQQSTGFIKIGGTQRPCSHYVKAGGVQRKVVRMWVKQGGVYR